MTHLSRRSFDCYRANRKNRRFGKTNQERDNLGPLTSKQLKAYFSEAKHRRDLHDQAMLMVHLGIRMTELAEHRALLSILLTDWFSLLALMRERIFLNVGRGQFAICQVPQFESQIFQVIFRHWLSKEFLNDREEVSQGANGRQGRSVTGPGETTERSEKKRRLNQRQGDAAVLQAASLSMILKACR